MKYIALLISFALSISAYNRDAAYNYAKKWWNSFNLSKYKNYNPDGGDCANFVSQCLIAGGLNLVSMCGSGDAWGLGGTVPNVGAMARCLKKNGWSYSSKIPTNFEKGDVILYGSQHAVIAVTGYPHVTYAAHNNNRWMAEVYYSPAPTFYHYTGKTTSGGGNGGGDDGCVKTCKPLRCVTDVAYEVIQGKYGNGEARFKKLASEGCDGDLVQDEVNRLLS